MGEVVDEEAGIMTETADGCHSTTEAIGTLEVALRKGAGVLRIAIATIGRGMIDTQKRSQGATQELIGTAEIYLRTRWALDPSTLKSLHRTAGTSRLLQLLRPPLPLDPYRIVGIARLGNYHPPAQELLATVMDRSLPALHLGHLRAGCQTAHPSLSALELSNRKPNGLQASNGLTRI